MKLGSKIFIILYFISFNHSFAQEKIILTPLINLEKIKPSFEDIDIENENINSQQNLKKKNSKNLKSSQAVLIGLDKITAKSSELVVNLNESKNLDL